MDVGDFFYLDRQPGEAVEVWAGERKRWLAEAGKVEGQVAARLLHAAEDGHEGEEDR
jgi:flagellar motor switch protein FliM